MTKTYDAVVVGSGPNGLAAAITVARAGRSVLVLEANAEAGGGARTGELTLPGFNHDLFSAVHPLAVASPFFRSLPLEKYGLEWLHSHACAAQTLEGGEAVLLDRSVDATAQNLGEDGDAYRNLMAPLARRWEDLFGEILQPVLHVPKHPFLLARFGLPSLLSAERFANLRFRGERARALFMGCAAHANAGLDQAGTASIGLMLSLAAHARGWPIPRGGAGRISLALLSYLQSLGGEIRTGEPIHSLKQLPPSKMVFLDLTPRQILGLGNGTLPSSYQNTFGKFKYGHGVFKMDWALSGPIPWTAKSISRSATVHLGGSSSEMAESHRTVAKGKIPAQPYVLLSQPTLFDPARAPAGKHIAWAYCQVPNGSGENMVDAIESQIERFAPGFKKLVLARSVQSPAELQAKNANLVGGDVAAGAVSLKQLLFRPTTAWNPYRMPLKGTYLCSASTPPGPGVHGMCGHLSALSALREL